MTDKELQLQKDSINPLAIIGQLIPGIQYTHEVMLNPPPTIRVETTIHGRHFAAQINVLYNNFLLVLIGNLQDPLKELRKD